MTLLKLDRTYTRVLCKKYLSQFQKETAMATIFEVCMYIFYEIDIFEDLDEEMVNEILVTAEYS